MSSAAGYTRTPPNSGTAKHAQEAGVKTQIRNVYGRVMHLESLIVRHVGGIAPAVQPIPDGINNASAVEEDSPHSSSFDDLDAELLMSTSKTGVGFVKGAFAIETSDRHFRFIVNGEVVLCPGMRCFSYITCPNGFCFFFPPPFPTQYL